MVIRTPSTRCHIGSSRRPRCSAQVARENRRMAEPFKKAKEDVNVLTKELEAYDGEKALLRQAKARFLRGREPVEFPEVGG